MSEWISVKDRLPEMDAAWYLVNKAGYNRTDDNGMDTYTAQGQATWYGHIGCAGIEPWGAGITHWMPLPDPPKEAA